MTIMTTLLIELLTEELPPKALPELAATFTRLISDELVKLGFTGSTDAAETFATPRRLACTLPHVLAIQPEQHIERRGPAVAAAFKDGEPTSALLGFARSCGVVHTELEKGHDGKQEVFIFRSTRPGVNLASVLPGLIEAALKKLPAPKMMRWGAREGQFIRPIHGLIILHGDTVISGRVLEIESRAQTLGHRFLSQGLITIPTADRYAQTLQETGKVIASFAKRREMIEAALEQQAASHGASLAPAPGLLDEVTALVEWPVVYSASFDPAFLAVPQECLILSMQQHQRYFALLDTQGKLLPHFLLVSNIATSTPQHIIQGNARVLRARLSDAQFFFTQDQKQTLASRVPKLAEVVYHNRLGSQLERVTRLQDISGQIAAKLGANTSDAARAAYLAKADLLTDMVGEFPELQGTMGMYYAHHDGESEVVAAAVAAHYQPRFAGDALPEGLIAQSVALADKLESIVGIYGIGLIPTGDKDPFGLRRAALGIARLLLTLPLNLFELLTITAQSFSGHTLSTGVVNDVHGFIRERLKNYLSQDYPLPHIEAVLLPLTGRLDSVLTRLNAVAEFIRLPEAAALAGANKRISNILKKYTDTLPVLNTSLFTEAAEKSLYAALNTLSPQIETALAAQDYTAALKALAILRQPVDNLFDEVMVMAEDKKIRENRLALLALLAQSMNQVADLSVLTD